MKNLKLFLATLVVTSTAIGAPDLVGRLEALENIAFSSGGNYLNYVASGIDNEGRPVTDEEGQQFKKEAIEALREAVEVVEQIKAQPHIQVANFQERLKELAGLAGNIHGGRIHNDDPSSIPLALVNKLQVLGETGGLYDEHTGFWRSNQR